MVVHAMFMLQTAQCYLKRLDPSSGAGAGAVAAGVAGRSSMIMPLAASAGSGDQAAGPPGAGQHRMMPASSPDLPPRCLMVLHQPEHADRTIDRARRRRRGGWRLVDRRSCSWRSEIRDRPWATGPKANSGWQRFGRTLPGLPVCSGFNAAEALSCVDQVPKAKGRAHVFGFSAPFITR